MSIYLMPEQQKARRELPPLFPIHSQMSSLPEAHAIEVPTELLGPGSPGAIAGVFPIQPRRATTASPYCGPKRVVGGDTRLHASNMPKEGKSTPSDSRLDVFEACVVLHLQVCYVIEPADF